MKYQMANSPIPAQISFPFLQTSISSFTELTEAGTVCLGDRLASPGFQFYSQYCEKVLKKKNRKETVCSQNLDIADSGFPKFKVMYSKRWKNVGSYDFQFTFSCWICS